jgi:hypothetical protein
MTYRIDVPTMVLEIRGKHQAAVTLPAGKLVKVIGPAVDDRFVVVQVDDKLFHLFASDLPDRRKTDEGGRSGRRRHVNLDGKDHDATPVNETGGNECGNDK